MNMFKQIGGDEGHDGM
jgi:hypothetical protein